nr:putative integron gene cassette protein [uncultured bacterium]
MESIEATVISLERELLDPATRSNYDRLDQLLAEDFFEVGANGRAFDKADVLSRLPSENGVEFSATDIQAHVLSSTVVLVTYVATRSHSNETLHSKRSSLWIRTSDGWEMRYHQGTASA